MPARCIFVPQVYLGHWDLGLLVISSLISHQLYPTHILLFFRDMKDISPQNKYTWPLWLRRSLLHLNSYMTAGVLESIQLASGQNIFCASLSSPVFNDLMLVAWNWSVWEYLHHGNWQMLQTWLFSPGVSC